MSWRPRPAQLGEYRRSGANADPGPSRVFHESRARNDKNQASPDASPGPNSRAGLPARLTKLIIALWLSASWSRGALASEADDLLGTDHGASFDAYLEQIDGLHVWSELGLARLGLTRGRALESARERFESAESDTDVYYALLSLQRSLHDRHSRLEVPEGLSPSSPRAHLPFRVAARHTGDGYAYVVTAAGEGAPPEGSTIVAVDGMSIASIERANVEWLPSSSPDHLRDKTAVWLTLGRPRDRPSAGPGARVVVRAVPPGARRASNYPMEWAVGPRWQRPTKPDAVARGLDCHPKAFPGPETTEVLWVGINSCVYETAEPDTFVVDLLSFNYELGLGDLWNRQRNLTWVAPALNPNQSPSAQLERLDVEELTTFLAERGARRVLLDVRHNGGGNVPTALLSRLSSEPFRILSRELRYGAGPPVRGLSARLEAYAEPDRYPLLGRARRTGLAALSVLLPDRGV